MIDTGMIDIGIFLKGFTIGLAIAAPVGPIGLLTIRRTHPFAMQRAKEVDEWFNNGSYSDLLERRSPSA